MKMLFALVVVALFAAVYASPALVLDSTVNIAGLTYPSYYPGYDPLKSIYDYYGAYYPGRIAPLYPSYYPFLKK